MIKLLLLTVLVCSTYGQSPGRSSCLRYGCPMTGGLRIENLDAITSTTLPPEEFADNVVTVLTYDISGGMESAKDWQNRKDGLCKYLNRIQAKVFGLQDVKENQLEDLKLCLSSYSSVAQKVSEKNGLYNPIFYKNERRLSLVKSGAFWLSNSPNLQGSKLSNESEPRVCQWARFRFAERQSMFQVGYSADGPSSLQGSPNENVFAKILRLLKIFTGKTPLPPSNLLASSIQSPRKIRYRLYDFYFAVTKLNPVNSVLANKEVRKLTKHLRNVVMDRRQYPMMLVGNFGFEDDSEVYETLNRKRWLKNSMATAKQIFHAMTLVHPNDFKNSLVDYIWYNRLRNLFSATMTDTDDENKRHHRPVLSVFLNQI